MPILSTLSPPKDNHDLKFCFLCSFSNYVCTPKYIV